MPTYKIADFLIEINNKYEYVTRQCSEYLYTGGGRCDFSVCVSEEEIERELEESETSNRGYAESVCIYRQIALNLPRYNSFLLHASTVAVDGRGYAFLARSGVGKSTHTRLWQELLGYRLTVVNGDKPIIRLIDGKFFAYGTPWCGKEGLQINTKVPLKALCFLERSKENFIEPQKPSDTVAKIFKQIILPQDREGAENTLELLDKLVLSTKSFCMHCNISLEAAMMCYQRLSQIE